MVELTEPYRKYSDALLAIVKGGWLDGRDVGKSFQQLTEIASHTLNVERSSVWMYDDDDRSGVHCIELYENSTGFHSDGGGTLLRSDYPSYFAALEHDRVVDAHDAETDPRTCELAGPYSDGLGITSILDGPTRLNGELIGIMCIEHVGEARRWTTEEIAFVGSLTDLLAHAVDARNRVLLEQELHEIEFRYARAARIAKLGHWAWDMIEDKLIYSSKEAAAFHGFTVEEYFAKASSAEHLIKLIHPDDQEAYRRAWQDHIENQSGFEIDFSVVLPDGDIRHLKEFVEAVVDDDGRLIQTVGTNMDISDLKQIEAELTKSLKIQDAVLSNISMGVSMIQADGKVIACNQQFFDIYNYPAEPFDGMGRLEELNRFSAEGGNFGTGNVDEKVTRRVDQAVIHDPSVNEISMPDGRIIEIRQTSLADGSTVITDDDITERKNANRRLKESEAKLKLAAQTASLGYWHADEAAEQFLSVSEELAQIFGYTAEEYLKRFPTLEKDMESVHPEDRARIYEAYEEECKDGIDYRIVRRDGSIGHVREYSMHITDDSGKLTESIGTVQDITELKEMQLRADRDKDSAEAANYAKSEFLANMSHELRTPLHSIISFADFGVNKTGSVSEEKLVHFFENIRASGDVLLGLIDNLLDLAKLEAGHTELDIQTVELGALVVETIREFDQIVIDTKVHIDYQPHEKVKVDIDSNRIRQVVRNLLGNAIKFSPSGGTIRVTVDKSSSGDGVQVQVTDQGPGIPEDEKELIFDKFIQSHRTSTGAGGTGLGLAISREIIASHHGSIWASNAAEGGAAFEFMIPLRFSRQLPSAETASCARAEL